jgi:HSP20 family protein
MNPTYEFPERLWRRPIEIHNGKPHPRIAAASYQQQPSYPTLEHERAHVDRQVDRDASAADQKPDPTNGNLENEPDVKVTAEAGNARVAVTLPSVSKKDLALNCAEDALTLSVKTSKGLWIKEIQLPFRVDPDTAKANFRNGRLEFVVRRHGKFNPPGPRLDWV